MYCDTTQQVGASLSARRTVSGTAVIMEHDTAGMWVGVDGITIITAVLDTVVLATQTGAYLL